MAMILCLISLCKQRDNLNRAIGNDIAPLPSTTSWTGLAFLCNVINMLYWKRILFTRPLEPLSSSSANVGEKKKKKALKMEEKYCQDCAHSWTCAEMLSFTNWVRQDAAVTLLSICNVLLHYDTTSPSTSFKKGIFISVYDCLFNRICFQPEHSM